MDRRFRERMLSGGTVEYCRSFDLVRVPYPTKYALRDACAVPRPFIHILNRMLIVQVRTVDGLKTVLVSPSDVDGNAETAWDHHRVVLALRDRHGDPSWRVEPCEDPAHDQRLLDERVRVAPISARL